MTRQQRQRRRQHRIELWRRLAGARPAWLVSLMLTIGGALVHEWLDVRDRLMKIETSQTHESATIAADVERLRRSISWRCPDACKAKP